MDGGGIRCKADSGEERNSNRCKDIGTDRTMQTGCAGRGAGVGYGGLVTDYVYVYGAEAGAALRGRTVSKSARGGFE